MARLRRTTSASSRTPTASPRFDRDTVVILSTMTRETSRSPLPGDNSISKRNSGASVGSVVNGQIVTESGSKRSSWIMTAGRPCRRSSARLKRPDLRSSHCRATQRLSRQTPGHRQPMHSPRQHETADAPLQRTPGSERQAPRSEPVASPAHVDVLGAHAPCVANSSRASLTSSVTCSNSPSCQTIGSWQS
jgi:hypothetical protein